MSDARTLMRWDFASRLRWAALPGCELVQFSGGSISGYIVEVRGLCSEGIGWISLIGDAKTLEISLEAANCAWAYKFQKLSGEYVVFGDWTLFARSQDEIWEQQAISEMARDKYWFGDHEEKEERSDGFARYYDITKRVLRRLRVLR